MIPWSSGGWVVWEDDMPSDTTLFMAGLALMVVPLAIIAWTSR